MTGTRMPHYVAFLRGINLGNRRPTMDNLRALFEELKFRNVSTFIASGNVIFEGKAGDVLKLEQQIEEHLQSALGYAVDTFVRTRAEVAAVAAFRPFSKADMDPPENTVHCGFLGEALSASQVRGLVACRTEVDEFRVEGREYYWLCRRIKTHESKVWTSRELKALKLPSSTMRNLTTLRKLAALYPVVR
ncbi:MAG TPA: DUF1697 domain-containing protein [Opitutaceae bacterium]|jgi:uncharacterized protein (DUF1697 family)|nr:DUF1697 domain-containing protein [Opitutaceae bacterium]